MSATRNRLLFAAALALLAGLFFAFDLHRSLTLAGLKAHQEAFRAYYAAHGLATLAGYFLLYVGVTALSLPGAAAMTVAGGALFGFWPALLVVSFASSIGATLAFLASRFLLRDWVQRRFGERLRTVNAGIEQEGAFYLFSLRLVPLFPFFVINLLFGLTPMKAATFYLVSQFGMLAGTAVFVNAGTRLGELASLAGLISPQLLFSLALLGLFPLLARRGLGLYRRYRLLAGFPRPRRFDYNLVVIGAGSAGLVAGYIAAALKAKVALIEKEQMGGDCLNTGCVPSKALLRSAKILAYGRRATEFGFRSTETEFTFGEVMERVQRVVRRVAPHDSAERYRALGVEVIAGEARVTSPYTVAVGDRVLTTRSIVVASGATPLVPPIPGLAEAGYLTSETVWNLRERPRRLAILGGGPIGCELAQAFARLGCSVTQVEMAPRLLLREDAEVAALLRERFEVEGIRLLTGHAARAVTVIDGEKLLLCDVQGEEVRIPCDQILVAVGRRPSASGFGLEELGVRLNPNGTIAADPLLRTNIPTIYCAGDVAGPWQFTHTAGHQAWYAAVNALLAPFKGFRVDSRTIPWCTFTDPEVARVGLNEEEALRQKIPYEVTRYPLAELDRAIVDGDAEGWVKILTVPGRDTILGVTIVGPHAGDLIAEYVLAMRHGIGLNRILATIHIYPTLAEANKLAAGVWKRAHAPLRLLAWLERFHAWRRG